MAYILIDAYNLIGTAHKDLEKARNSLIEKLCRYSNLKGHNITLVFDGWKDGRPEETRMRIGDVNIIFSRLGEKADLVIKRILTESRKPWIVVSSDREISDFANNKDFAAITADEFESKLHSILYTAGERRTEESFKYYENIDIVHPKKGNPRKLSKKQRRKLQALKKL